MSLRENFSGPVSVKDLVEVSMTQQVFYSALGQKKFWMGVLIFCE